MSTLASESGKTAVATELDTEAADRLRAAIGKLSRRLRATAATAGMSPSQVAVLFTIVRRGPIGLSELAAVEAMNPTMVSRLVAQLTDLGLVRRTARADDRRAATVAATATGRRLRERVHRERSRTLSGSLAELERSEQAALLGAIPALERLAARLEERGR